ncbi:hypothetical protein M0R45_033669 [Rubus argutus]|uniref:Methyltransferase n=1 Tax=Rubus argutus TaxID=59490 RepID=A0AAW1WKY6_RUBAR
MAGNSVMSLQGPTTSRVCLDNWKSIRKLPTTMHYEHRERNCPEEASTCLVPLPQGYKQPIQVANKQAHTKLAFKNSAFRYIDFIQNFLPAIVWRKRTSVKFDLVHCARCSVPWHVEDGKLLLELNCVLRPGGYFVWSATPVYQKLPEDVGIWKGMSILTKIGNHLPMSAKHYSYPKDPILQWVIHTTQASLHSANSEMKKRTEPSPRIDDFAHHKIGSVKEVYGSSRADHSKL